MTILESIADLRRDVWAAGYRPVDIYNAVLGDEKSGKRPYGDDWRERALADPPAAVTSPVSPGHVNTGILCDGLRAADVDIDDATLADEIRSFIEFALGDTIIRTREGFGRCLLLYRAAEGQPRKRVFKGPRGKVEILGAGQQFVAFGDHHTGVTLTWPKGSPVNTPLASLPTVTEEQLTALSIIITEMLGGTIAAPKHVTMPDAPAPSTHGAVADSLDVAAALAVIPNSDTADWEAWNRVGMAVWRATCGSQSGFATWSAWSDRNPAHDPEACEERWSHYWKSPPTALGAGTLFYLAKQARPDWRKPTEAADDRAAAEEFGDLPDEPATAPSDAAPDVPWTRRLQINPRTMRAEPNLSNIISLLRHHPDLLGVFRLNTFTGRIMVMRRAPWSDETTPRLLTDTDTIGLTAILQRLSICVADDGLPATTNNSHDAIGFVAKAEKFDSLRDYLDVAHKRHDRTAKLLDCWGIDYLGTPDTPLMRAACRRFLIGAVARAYDPGCQLDSLPVFEGPQGLKKSSMLQALFSDDYFSSSLPDIHNVKAAGEAISGKWCIEIAEMAAVSKIDVERIKAFITSRNDYFRPAYGRVTEDHKRRCVFAATINPDAGGYLRDATGARRFWPIPCGVGWPACRRIDTVALAAVRDQLWGEAVAAYRTGEAWWLDNPALEAEQIALADERHDADAWADVVENYIAGMPWVRMGDIFVQIGVSTNLQDAGNTKRVVRILTKLHWTMRQPRAAGGRRERRYYPPAYAPVDKPAPDETSKPARPVTADFDL